MTDKIRVPIFFCEMLVDQNRYIGTDPVGRKCPNTATHELKPTGHLICESCAKMLVDEPDRITIPPIAHGFTGQKKLAEQILSDMIRRIKEDAPKWRKRYDPK